MSFLGRWVERSYRRRLLDRDLARIAHDLRGRVLEIGAGQRRRGHFRPPAPGVGSWICLDRTASRAPDVRGDVRELPFRDVTFDTVVCLEVLEYVDDPAVALAEMARVLRPDGLLALSIPFLHRWDADDDLWRATPEGLRRLLARGGFAVAALQPQGGALATVANILGYVAQHAFESRLPRGMLMLVVAPITEILFRLDPALTRRRPVLSTFATGYLVLARRT